jgi:hypothetical protein
MNFRNNQNVRHLQAFQDSIVFEVKAGAYSSEAPFRHSTQGKAPGLAHKQ